MARIFKFMRPRRRHRRARRFPVGTQSKVIALLVFVAALILGELLDLDRPRAIEQQTNQPGSRVISCFRPRVIDGDTFTCDSTRIRLANIDAPELPGHCRPGRRCVEGDAFAARDHLKTLASGYVSCRAAELDHYGRTVAFCEAEGTDLSCAMVKSGHAARRYGGLVCPD